MMEAVANDDAVMSKRDYDSMQETLLIQSNPYLFNKIQEGIKQINEGKA